MRGPNEKRAELPLRIRNEVLIQVTGEGNLALNGEEATHEEIDERLRGISRDVRLVLRIDRTTCLRGLHSVFSTQPSRVFVPMKNFSSLPAENRG